MDNLQGLADKQAITELCSRYAIAIDTRDWTLLRSCFQPDVIGHYGGDTCTGYEEIEAMCKAALVPLAVTQHLIGTLLVELHEDEAEVVSYLQAQHVRPGLAGGDHFIFAGRYLDRVVRTAAGWRIAERRLEPMWTAGNSAVLA